MTDHTDSEIAVDRATPSHACQTGDHNECTGQIHRRMLGYDPHPCVCPCHRADGPPDTPADTARHDGRPTIANVTHPYQPGWVTFQPADIPISEERPGASAPTITVDPDRCRTCGRPEHPWHHDSAELPPTNDATTLQPPFQPPDAWALDIAAHIRQTHTLSFLGRTITTTDDIDHIAQDVATTIVNLAGARHLEEPTPAHLVPLPHDELP